MNVMFFISVHGHGRGGHFNSLHHISNELAVDHQVNIVSIGPGFSPIVSENKNFRTHLYFNGLNIIGFKRQCNALVKQYNPQIIHCFDVGAYNILRLLYSTKKIKIALNLCGGPNPNKFPYVKNLVLFSVENKKWFESSDRYKDSNIALIPNRVSTIQTKILDVIKDDEVFTFVRIARIGKTYEKSIFDSIALIDTLYKRNSNLKLKLFIIGVVECHETLANILKNQYVKNGMVEILTDDKYTNNASKMLYLADAVIGTGRGIMEAASIGLPLLTVNSLSNMPVLITKETFEDAFKTNFSERNIYKNLLEEKNISLIEKLVSDATYYQELSIYTRAIFEQYFDIDNAANKYVNFYKATVTDSKRDLFQDSILILKTLYSFFKSSRKVK